MNGIQYLHAVKQLVEQFKERMSTEYDGVLEQTLNVGKQIPQKISVESDSVSKLRSYSQKLIELQAKYKKIELVLNKLHTVENCFSEAIPYGSPNSVYEAVEKNGRAAFSELKRSEEFKEIMSEIAYDAWEYEKEKHQYDDSEKFYDGLENGLEAKFDSLEARLEQGSLSKEQCIINEILCMYLYDNQDYQDYIGLAKKTK